MTCASGKPLLAAVVRSLWLYYAFSMVSQIALACTNGKPNVVWSPSSSIAPLLDVCQPTKMKLSLASVVAVILWYVATFAASAIGPSSRYHIAMGVLRLACNPALLRVSCSTSWTAAGDALHWVACTVPFAFRLLCGCMHEMAYQGLQL